MLETNSPNGKKSGTKGAQGAGRGEGAGGGVVEEEEEDREVSLSTLGDIDVADKQIGNTPVFGSSTLTLEANLTSAKSYLLFLCPGL